jgi:hypothetical protein
MEIGGQGNADVGTIRPSCVHNDSAHLKPFLLRPAGPSREQTQDGDEGRPGIPIAGPKNEDRRISENRSRGRSERYREIRSDPRRTPGAGSGRR